MTTAIITAALIVALAILALAAVIIKTAREIKSNQYAVAGLIMKYGLIISDSIERHIVAAALLFPDNLRNADIEAAFEKAEVVCPRSFADDKKEDDNA